MLARELSSRSGSAYSGVTFRSTSSLRDYDAAKKETVFILASRSAMLFTIFGISIATCLICGIVRSAYILADTVGELDVLKDAEKKIIDFKLVESMADFVYKESFARMKYLTTNMNPTYYAEITDAINANDILFAQNMASFQEIYLSVPEYRQYNCSPLYIKTNLASRASAVPLTHHRTLDEKDMNAWDDTDFYECVLSTLAELQSEQVARARGFDYLWQFSVAYYLSLRSIWNFELGLTYAFITRELILNKGSVNFLRERDWNNLDDSLAVSEKLIETAYRITPREIGQSSLSAVELLNQLLPDFSSIQNASKAYILVPRNDKFEPTPVAKSTLNYLIAAKEEFKQYLIKSHSEAIENADLSIVSEAVKLGFFALILPVLAFRCLIHMKNEADRLLKRCELCQERYIDSCKAIFRLLPEPVAKKLNAGVVVRPEFFHNVTVFYSDIVGFTSICSRLTASEVLTLLNAIYTTFDSRTNAYQCYKIETIGDAYVVASGVPTRTSTHAAEIASLALVIVEEVGLIKQAALNKQKIRIRIGINSGPVTAGIVGVKMLRYCLFGKTVLYANKMEQTSQPQRIQLSHSSYNELLKQGGFLMSERPKNEWPDGQPTYWLTGRITASATLSLFRSARSDLTEINLG